MAHTSQTRVGFGECKECPIPYRLFGGSVQGFRELSFVLDHGLGFRAGDSSRTPRSEKSRRARALKSPRGHRERHVHANQNDLRPASSYHAVCKSLPYLQRDCERRLGDVDGLCLRRARLGNAPWVLDPVFAVQDGCRQLKHSRSSYSYTWNAVGAVSLMHGGRLPIEEALRKCRARFFCLILAPAEQCNGQPKESVQA